MSKRSKPTPISPKSSDRRDRPEDGTRMDGKPKVNISEVTREDKLNISTWFVTINTNRVPKSQADIEKFRSQLHAALEDVTAYIIPNKYEGYTEGDPTMQVEIKQALEIGKKYHRLHAHVFIVCHHDSNLKIDEEYFKDEIDDVAFVKVKYVKANADFQKLINYMRKDY